MFKFTIVIAALAVSASMAANSPRQQQQQQERQNIMTSEPTASATVMSHQQKQKPYVYVAEVEEQEAGLGLGAVATTVIGQLKSLGAKGLIKIALLSGLAAVAVAVSAAGLVAIVTSLWSTAMRLKHGMGGGHGEKWAESRVDEISEFVLDAFNKYGVVKQ